MQIAVAERVLEPVLEGRSPRLAAARDWQPAITAGVALFLGLAALALYLFLPRARVVLYPPTQPIEGSIELRADPAAQAVDARSGRIPARVSYVVVDANEQAVTQGRLPDPNARALGTVTFANRLGGLATVPAGTLVMTPSGVRFATAAEVTVDAAPGALGHAPVRAIEPGDKGNVARLEINRIVGPLAGQVAVLNEEPTVGGGQGDAAAIADEDVARVRQAAAERARADALAQLRADTRTDEMLVPQSLEYAVISEELDRRPGDRATTFGYRLRARISGARVGTADVRDLVRRSWKPEVPAGYFLPEQQLEIATPEVVRVENGVLVMRAALRTVAVARVDADVVRERVRWRDADEARRDLARSLKLVAEPRVTVEPRWASRALRVDVALDLNPPTGAHG